MPQRTGSITTTHRPITLTSFTSKGETYEVGEEVRLDTTQGTRKFRCRAVITSITGPESNPAVTVVVTKNISNENLHSRHGHSRTVPPSAISR